MEDGLTMSRGRYAKLVKKLPVNCPYLGGFGEFCVLPVGSQIRKVTMSGTRWRFEAKTIELLDGWEVCYSQVNPVTYTNREQLTAGRLPESGTFRLTAAQRDIASKLAQEWGVTLNDAVTRVLTENVPGAKPGA